MVRQFLIISALLITLVSQAQVAPDMPEPNALKLIDARPPIQSKGGFESLNIMRCAYASKRLTDEHFGIDRIKSLRQVLTDHFPELAGRTITVKNYASHLNTYIASKGLASRLTAAQIGGAVGGAITGSTWKSAKVIGCGPDNLTGGYVAGEVPVEVSPIISVIDLELDGHLFHFRSVSGTADPNGFSKRPEVGKNNYSSAHSQAMERLIPAFASFLMSASGQR